DSGHLILTRPNPLVSEIDEHLNILRDFETTSTSSSISHKINGLQDVYDFMDKLLQFPFSQQELAQEQNKRPVDELFDGSFRLFYLCNTAKDILLKTKESIQDIQSILRKRLCGEVELVGEVKKHFTSRKVVQKTIHKALKNALVSKLLHHKRIACEQVRRRGINEFEKVHAALRSVMSQKMRKYENVEMPRQLKELELCV
ncbi:hypothetical protein Golax_018601, partial [Gossypium laxum]|nr:hypothetical protein [Gossypium laxum]